MSRRWAPLVLRQLARALVAVVLVALVASLLAEAAPGSAPERAARAAGVLPPPDAAVPDGLRAELLATVARDHGLDRSLAARLFDVARFDFGSSWVDGEPVGERLAATTGRTLWLALLALLVAALLGTGAALLAARRPGGPADGAIAVAAALAVALPPVWLAILAMRILAAGQPWSLFPLSGGLVLPALVLAVVPAFVIARHLRAALVDARDQPWALAARARGISDWQLVARHCLRAELPALLPLVVSLVAYLIGAAVVVEQVFDIPGLGRALVDAAGRGDQPLVVGACATVAAIIATSAGLVELGRRALDPRGAGDAS